jgi:hypothetical protein
MRGQVRGVCEAEQEDTGGLVLVICLPRQCHVDHGRQYNNQGDG